MNASLFIYLFNGFKMLIFVSSLKIEGVKNKHYDFLVTKLTPLKIINTHRAINCLTTEY